MNSHCVPWQSEYHLNNDRGMPLLLISRCFCRKQSLKWEYVEHFLCFIDAITYIRLIDNIYVTDKIFVEYLISGKCFEAYYLE